MYLLKSLAVVAVVAAATPTNAAADPKLVTPQWHRPRVRAVDHA
jgi:hypothetical protein